MTTLLFELLEDELIHNFSLNLNRRYHIACFAPYLYMHGSPVGTFTFEILKNDLSIFSKVFNCDDIKSSLNTTDDYAHVFYPIIPEVPLQLEKGTYKAKITSEDYVSGASFLGWIKQFEDLNNELDYVPDSVEDHPLAMRIKELKEGYSI